MGKMLCFLECFIMLVYYISAFNSVYHKTVVLCTHLLIRKTMLFIYLFT